MLYRFINVLIEPFVCSQLLAAIVLAVLWYRRPLSRRWLVALTVPWALLYVMSLPATGFLLLGSLEWSYPPQESWPEESPAIVILSGGYLPPDAVRLDMEPSANTLHRLLLGERVYREHGRCPVIVSGGNLDPSRMPHTDAEKMRDVLAQLGVPEADIVLESESRSTYENALFSAKILQDRGFDRAIVVTDAFHMRRSELCFLRQGIQIDPAPCSHRATEWTHPFVYWFLPERSALESSQLAIREWIGHVWYYLHGRI